MYEVRTRVFNGPLETLLGMIEERELSVSEVSLAEVCEQFVAHIRTLDDFPLRDVSRFLVIAATLLVIKSRSLIPSLEITEDEETDIRELQDRLAHYALVRRAARVFDTLLQSDVGMWSRQPYRPVAPSSPSSYTITGAVLLSSLRGILSVLPVEPHRAGATIERSVRIEEKIEELIRRVEKVFDPGAVRDRTEAIVTFLALLEILKSGLAAVRQDMPFGLISYEPA